MDEVFEARRARWRVRVGAAVVLVLVAIGCAVLVTAMRNHGGGQVIATTQSAASPPDPPAATIMVHVLGAVAYAGVYELPHGARGIDAIAAAGGFADDADRAHLNLARFLADGEQLVVPTEGEALAQGAATDGRVNLNTADRVALESLPRVGPALAERIIAWRDANGPFTAVEDLLAVNGIGEKTLAGFRDLVTL